MFSVVNYELVHYSVVLGGTVQYIEQCCVVVSDAYQYVVQCSDVQYSSTCFFVYCNIVNCCISSRNV